MPLQPWSSYGDDFGPFDLGMPDQTPVSEGELAQTPFAASSGSAYASSSSLQRLDAPEGQAKGPSVLSQQSAGPGNPYASLHDHDSGSADGQTAPGSDKEAAGAPNASISAASAQPASLRRGMACAFCRRRKLKCSGEKPKCTSCIKYSQQCEYGQAAKASRTAEPLRTAGEHLEYLGSQTASVTQAAQVPPPLSSSFDSLTNAGNISNSASWSSFLNLPVTTTSLAHTMFPLGAGQQTSFLPFGTPPQQHYSSAHDHTAVSTFGHAGTTDMLYDSAVQSSMPAMETSSAGTSSQPFKGDSGPHVFIPSMSSTTTNSSYNSPESGQDLTNAQQKASASRYFKTSRMASRSQSQASLAPSGSETPDKEGIVGPPLGSTVNPSTPNQPRQVVRPSMLYGNPPPKHVLNTAHIDPIDGITESLGEFLFDPIHPREAGKERGSTPKETPLKKRRGDGLGSSSGSSSVVLIETDGLEDGARDLLLDCFLAHSRLFFEMSIPRFRYRMTFHDRRRPAPALLYAMYLWATRISNKTQQAPAPLEQHFFSSACSALDISCANGDRLMDCLRAAMLLASYTYTTGRYHEGWILSGLACRLVLSTGLHQISTSVFSPEPQRDMFLRGQAYLLPPPEDAMELAERISTFWSIIAVDRAAALATGFPVGIRDDNIITPFPHPITDIASRIVTQYDDFTVRDLYRQGFLPSTADQPFSTWMKAVIILERASKLAFAEPEESSNYAVAWNNYFIQSTTNPSLSPPPAWLDQPKHRSPTAYATTKLGLEQLIQHLGDEGIYPLDRKRQAELEGSEMPVILPHTVLMHQLFCATHMFLHDINAPCVENEKALSGARKSVELMRHIPTPHRDTDAFIIMVWSIVAKIFAKELRRLVLIGDQDKMGSVEADMDLLIEQMGNVGEYMQLARSQARALAELKRLALKSPLSTSQASPEADFEEYYHREPSRPSTEGQHQTPPPPPPPPPPQPQQPQQPSVQQGSVPSVMMGQPHINVSIHGATFDANWPDPL